MLGRNGPEGRNDTSDTNDKTKEQKRQQEIQQAREKVRKILQDALGGGLAGLPKSTDQIYRDLRMAPPSIGSYTKYKKLQKGDGSDEANQKRAQDQADFKNSVVKAAAKSSGYEAPKVAANIGNQDLKSQGTQVYQKPSFTSDFADPKGLTDTPVVSTNYDKDVKGESSIMPTNILKDNAAKGSEGRSTESFSRGFQDGVASGNTDANKYVLSKPVQNIPLPKPNRLASN